VSFTQPFTDVTLDQAETDFQRALLTNDVAALDQVLHEDVHFIGPDGATIDKATDLEGHRSEAFTLTAVDELDRQVQVIEGVGITRTTLHLLGATREQQAVDVVLAYTRTWVPSTRGWLIISAHGSLGVRPAV
jgi:Domain of unknown function (DUF4440)